MSTFPTLKTGAIAQYPATRELHFFTEIQKFLDTSEQRYRDFRGAQRRWRIDLSQLDESELARLANFFVETQGRFATFDFKDPWTGMVVSNCRFGEDRLPIHTDDESNSSTELTIVETIGP